VDCGPWIRGRGVEDPEAFPGAAARERSSDQEIKRSICDVLISLYSVLSNLSLRSDVVVTRGACHVGSTKVPFLSSWGASAFRSGNPSLGLIRAD
jgi:hypothetical protein